MKNKIALIQESKKSQVLAVMQENKIRSETVKNISDHLKRLFIVLGLSERQIPNEIEYGILLNTYKTFFSEYSIKEIEYAIELSIKDKIQVELNLYDKPFSVVHISNIMKKYKAWRNENSDFKNNRALLAAPPEKTPDEIWNIMAAAAIKSFNNYKEGNPENIKSHIYDWLDENKIINISKELKWEAVKKAKGMLGNEAESKMDFPIYKYRSIVKMYSSESVEISRAKEILLKDYYNGLIEFEENLQAFINEIKD